MTAERGDIIEGGPAEAGVYENYPEWLKGRLEWFRDQRFGLILHWGVYCQWDCCESWPLVEEDTWARRPELKCWSERDFDFKRFQKDYWELNRTFNPTGFDPGAWADAARYAGMRYVTFTTKHHDGFCMWDTKTTDYRVTHPDCPFHVDPRADIARHVFDAFRERGLAISCYFSKSDWRCPYYWSPDGPAKTRNPNYNTHERPEIWQQFVDFVHAQIGELMTDYGPVDVLWLDGGQVRPPDQDIDMARLAAMARSHQPGLIIADRTVGGPYENILTPEQQIPDEPLPHPWESCLTMARDWCYSPGDIYKPTAKLLEMLFETVSKNGNLLMGVGPKPDGTLPAEALERLREIGDWMAVNAEAIHETRAVAPYKTDAAYFTCKGEMVYAIVPGRAFGDGPASPPEVVEIAAPRPADGSEVVMLGHPGELRWTTVDGRARIELPAGNLPCRHAWVLRYRPARG